MGKHSEDNCIGNSTSTQEIPIYSRYMHEPRHLKSLWQRTKGGLRWGKKKTKPSSV